MSSLDHPPAKRGVRPGSEAPPSQMIKAGPPIAQSHSTAPNSHPPAKRGAPPGSEVPPPKKHKIGTTGQNQLAASPAHLASLTTPNSTASPLLRLPAEIRNKIWAYASTSDHIRIVRQTTSTPTTFYAVFSPKPALCLPQVSRQIHAETATLAYSLSTFVFPWESRIDGSLLRDMVAWSKTLSEGNRSAITAVEVNGRIVEEYCHGRRGFGFRNVFPGLEEVCVSMSGLAGGIFAKAAWRETGEQVAERVVGGREGVRVSWRGA